MYVTELTLACQKLVQYYQNHLSSRFFTIVRKSPCFQIAPQILLRTSTWSLQVVFTSLRYRSVVGFVVYTEMCATETLSISMKTKRVFKRDIAAPSLKKSCTDLYSIKSYDETNMKDFALSIGNILETIDEA